MYHLFLICHAISLLAYGPCTGCGLFAVEFTAFVYLSSQSNERQPAWHFPRPTFVSSVLVCQAILHMVHVMGVVCLLLSLTWLVFGSQAPLARIFRCNTGLIDCLYSSNQAIVILDFRKNVC